MSAILRFRVRPFLVLVAFVLSSTGCALRATTDFGPQSESSTHSFSAGPEGMPGGVTGVSGPGGDSVGLRPGGDLSGAAGSPGATTGAH